ncbi:MAG: FecR domain-containing protein [Deltaproteobacteria bacterium]|nr:FecR domain-containing protein [Deltaproteobacteria bacterium]
MSACDPLRVLALVDGDVPAAGRAEVERHLEQCASCRQVLQRLRAARAALATVREIGAAPDESGVDFGRVQARIRAELDEPLRPAIGWFRRPLVYAAVGAAAVAALVVGLRSGRTPPAGVAIVGPARPTGADAVALRLRALPILVQGDVKQVPAGAPVTPAQPLDQGEGARVGSGRLVLQLEDGTAVVVAPRSEVSLRQLDSQRIDVRLGSGKAYARVAPRRAGQLFAIQTAGHAVLVRGTRYSVERLPAATRVEVLEGEVEVHTVGTGWDRLGARVPAGTVMIFPDGENPTRLSGTGMTPAERAGFEAGSRARLLADFGDVASALAASGVLEIQATPIAGDVTVDQEPVGATPLALRAPRGKRLVEIARPGYQRDVRTIDLDAEPRGLSVRLFQTGEENVRAAELARHARVHQHHVKACYDKALRQTPGLEGVVKLRLGVAADGRIAAARALPGSGLPASVEACLVTAVKRWPIGGGAPVTVDYPIVLKPELSFETP